jgi:cytochrome b561
MTTTARALPSRYGAVAMSLHWLIAAAIIVNIVLALVADDLPRGSPERLQMWSTHKSIGFLVLAFSVLRLIWRLTHPAPAPAKNLPAAIRIAGVATHHLLYLLMIGIPLVGWLMVSAGSQGHGTPVFGLFDWPAFPFLTDLPRSAAHPWHEGFESAHVLLGWAMICLVPLHVGAALYHHALRKDNVLLRMLPWGKLRNE